MLTTLASSLFIAVEEILKALGVVIVVALAAVVGWWARLHEKKRRQALAALAAELGMRFSHEKDSSHDEVYAHFEIFRKGHSRVAYNTIEGRIEVDTRAYDVRMGDFRYKITHHTGKTTTTQTYRFSYVIVHLPFGAALPELLIRREGMFDKLAGAIGFDDIDFESVEFSRKFHVKSTEKRFAYDVIHPRMMEFLLAGPTPTVDIERGRCCVADGRARWEPAGFSSHLEWLRVFFDLWPDHLTAQLDPSAAAPRASS